LIPVSFFTTRTHTHKLWWWWWLDAGRRSAAERGAARAFSILRPFRGSRLDLEFLSLKHQEPHENDDPFQPSCANFVPHGAPSLPLTTKESTNKQTPRYICLNPRNILTANTNDPPPSLSQLVRGTQELQHLSARTLVTSMCIGIKNARTSAGFPIYRACGWPPPMPILSIRALLCTSQVSTPPKIVIHVSFHEDPEFGSKSKSSPSKPLPLLIC
jgi:hypothetical protein